MNWFELEANGLGYQNIMGASRSREELPSEMGWSSFSEIDWYFYFLIVLVLAALGWLVFRLFRSINLSLGSYWKVSTVLLFVLIVYAAFFVTLLWQIPFLDIPNRLRDGAFGDSFGTLNTLFSGFAFSGVLITLLMQRKDLAEQRKDSKDAREQNARQQTESQFYNMLSLQQQVVQAFDLHRLGTGAHTIQGRDCFRDWGRKLKTRHDELRASNEYNHTKARAMAAFDIIMQGHQGDLGLYFRSLYSIFRFIERSEYAGEDFALVVRSFLSDYELVMLFYNCLSDKGEKFGRFAVAYALFDNLDTDLLVDDEHVVFMDRKSYGGNEKALTLWDKHNSEPQRSSQGAV